ncbi:YlxM family DNA-binding protein [Moorella sulfitireducens (nom. illeg.)]|uniref:YlxM family DNA-binding protein n=1 Tax=Neomoorella sulfitireducens TaxID=2972948 RepID=UPI0021AC2AF2|nr:YlxM family DNA-binding protein [Moorella sulfitireducens]
MLDQLARVARLYDFYGPLLTPKQRQLLELHYHHDLSLGEIAEEEGISRQAVYDGLHRAIKALEDYEARLGYLQRELTLRERLAAAVRHLENYRRGGGEGELAEAYQILERLLELPEGSAGKN